MLLRDARSKEHLSSFNNTDGSDQCPNTSIAHYAEVLGDHWVAFMGSLVESLVCYRSGHAMADIHLHLRCHVLFTGFQCLSSLWLLLKTRINLHVALRLCRQDALSGSAISVACVGISVLIVTSFYPVVYYSFLCQPYWVVIYLSSTTILGMPCWLILALHGIVGLGTIIASLVSYMQKPKFRRFRALMFSSLGLFGIIPWAHQLLINYNEPTIQTAIVYEIIMGAFYLVPVLIAVDCLVMACVIRVGLDSLLLEFLKDSSQEPSISFSVVIRFSISLLW